MIFHRWMRVPASPTEQGWGERDVRCKASSTSAWKTAPAPVGEAHARQVYLISAFTLLEDVEKKWRRCREELKELEKFFLGRNWERWAS